MNHEEKLVWVRGDDPIDGLPVIRLPENWRRVGKSIQTTQAQLLRERIAGNLPGSQTQVRELKESLEPLPEEETTFL